MPNYKIIGLMGMLVSLLAFFLALLWKDKISGFFTLIFPVSLLVDFFFIGIAREGTIKGGVRQALLFLAMLLAVITYGYLLRAVKAK